MKQNTDFSFLLLDAIGQIDDRFVAEAAHPPAKEGKTPLRLRPIHGVLIAACALLLAFPILSLSIALQGANTEDMSLPSAPDHYDQFYDREDAGGSLVVEPDASEPSYSTTTAPLSRHLLNLKSKVAVLAVDRATLNLKDGTYRILWQYEDSDTLYALPLTPNAWEDLNGLDDSLGSPLTEAPGLRLWVSDGQGGISTPYRPQDCGDDLFDYVPTREPSDEWSTEFLSLLEFAILQKA